MKVTVEAHIRWNISIDEDDFERIAEAFHDLESERGLRDMTVGGSIKERSMEISFGMDHISKQPLEELVPSIRQMIEDVLRVKKGFPSDVPQAHVIDAMNFRPHLAPQS